MALKTGNPKYQAILVVFLLNFLLLFSSAISNAQDQASVGDGIPTEEAAIASGKALYENNCTQCHAINEVVVGPALKNSHERWKLNNLVNFIRYPQKYIETSGDKYAQALYAQYKQYMPNHDFLSEAEVLTIIGFIKAESNKAPEVALADNSTVESSQAGTSGSGVSEELITLVFGVLIFILLIFLVILVLLINVLKKFIDKKKELVRRTKNMLIKD